MVLVCSYWWGSMACDWLLVISGNFFLLVSVSVHGLLFAFLCGFGYKRGVSGAFFGWWGLFWGFLFASPRLFFVGDGCGGC